MYITISNKCKGCGICSAINPKIFKINDGYATVNQNITETFEDDCIDAVLSCPFNAIKINEF